MVDLKKMQKISIVWGLLLFVLVFGLTAIGIVYKNKSVKYKDLEKDLEEKTKQYVELKFLYPEDDDSIKITFDELKNEKIVNELKVEDDFCDGYVNITKENGVFKYKPYIKCNKYTTKNYKK